MTQAVTVASPFYGYHDQIVRWFERVSFLNHVGPFDLTLEMIQVITSLPGCYVLPYLDYNTFETNELALKGDPDFPLAGYPSTDAVIRPERCMSSILRKSLLITAQGFIYERDHIGRSPRNYLTIRVLFSRAGAPVGRQELRILAARSRSAWAHPTADKQALSADSYDSSSIKVE